MEINRALYRIGPEKALGPDGLNAHFFQKYWNQVGSFVTKMVDNFFQSNKLDNPINFTRIILIPKNNNPYLISHYRPINLCNVTYKITSNISVNRIRPFMDKIISPYQNAFVPKRLISDNISLPHELLHTVK